MSMHNKNHFSWFTATLCKSIFALSLVLTSTYADNGVKTKTILGNSSEKAENLSYKKLLEYLANKGLQDGFNPIEPIIAPSLYLYDKKTNAWKEVPIEELNNTQLKENLAAQTVTVKVYKFDETGGLQAISGATLSQSSGKYKVIMDYMKYRIEPLYEENDMIGFSKVGVGLRVHANVETNSGNINLGSLLAIGIAANAQNLKGDISVEVIGMDSPDITNLIPLTSSIDQTSIQAVLQAMASIKAKLNDDKTVIKPHVVGYTNLSSNKSDKSCEQKEKCVKCFICF